jgi:hypothetical protein
MRSLGITGSDAWRSRKTWGGVADRSCPQELAIPERASEEVSNNNLPAIAHLDRVPSEPTTMSDRRTFLKRTAAIGGALGLSPLAKLPLEADVPLARPQPGRASATLNILILGGTGFTGPEQVDYAIARGHRVTLFNRGKTRPGLFKGRVAEELIGDLNSDTSALKGKRFDVVIDNPTTLPVWVRNAAQHLEGNTRHYIFISTTSVYRDQSEIGINENSPTVPMPAGVDPYQPDWARRPTSACPPHARQGLGDRRLRELFVRLAVAAQPVARRRLATRSRTDRTMGCRSASASRQ